MESDRAKQELGKRIKEVLTGQLRTVGMFVKKLDTRIDGSFTVKTEPQEKDREVYYTLQTKTVKGEHMPETVEPRVETDGETRKEIQVLEDLVRDYKYKQMIRNEEYQELPPEFTPEDNKDKEQALQFLKGRTDGLLAAYEYVTGEMFSVALDKPKYSDMDSAMAGEKQTLTQAKNRLEELRDST